MVGPSAVNIIVNDVVLRLILSVTTSAFWLLIVLIFIKIFKIKNPNLKYALLTVPLIKGLLAVITDIPVSRSFKGSALFYIKIPNLGIMEKSRWWERVDSSNGAFFYPTMSLSPIALIIILSLILSFTVWRLIGMFRFLAMVKKAKELDRSRNEFFFQVLDRMVAKAKIQTPRIISVESSGTPFTVGTRKPIIAVSTHMMEKLEPAEIEAILAHEISHIIRKDHLFHWPIVILRDILCFNPVTHYLHHRISFEKERACDQMASRQIKPLTLAKGIVKIAEMQKSLPPLPLVSRYAPQSLASQSGILLRLRVKELVDQKTPFIFRGLFRRILIIVSFLILVILEFHIITKINGYIFVVS